MIQRCTDHELIKTGEVQVSHHLLKTVEHSGLFWSLPQVVLCSQINLADWPHLLFSYSFSVEFVHQSYLFCYSYSLLFIIACGKLLLSPYYLVAKSVSRPTLFPSLADKRTFTESVKYTYM